MRLHAWHRYRRSSARVMPDVTEAALLFELVGIAEAAHVREHAVLQADEEHDRELETLRGVQRHQRDRARLGIVLVEIGDERDRLEERLHARQPVGVRHAASSALAPTPTPPIADEPAEVARARPARRTRAPSRPAPAGSRCGPCDFDRALGFELGEVAAARQHRLERRRRRRRPPRPRPRPSARAGRGARRAPCR